MNRSVVPRHHAALTTWLAAVVVLSAAAAASAFSLWPYDLPKQPQPYVVEGYLDKAPANTKILDEIEISMDKHERKLLITSYGYGELPVDLHLSRNMSHSYSIRGPREDLDRLSASPAGTRIEGTFAAYTDGPPWLLISVLNFPTDDEKPKASS